MNVIELERLDATTVDRAGGKAAGLGELITAGERVPAGFCITTGAYERAREGSGEVPDDVRTEIIEAYRRLGGGAVAVRSSATAEDLPYASFAGQQDTYLNVDGEDALVEAVRKCWDSLWTERAVHYREHNGIDHDTVRMAVVVQRMVDAEVAGVLFTANPVTGSRSEMVVDAAPGLGTAVVDGSVTPDHYVLDSEPRADPEGCLTASQLAELYRTGQRIEQHFGAPQDAEWAIDSDGTLWLVQSRAVTTLFPLPGTDRPGPRVYLSASTVQGVLQPLTPMGMSVMKLAGAGMCELARIRVDRFDGPLGFVDIGGRLFVDLTSMVRSKVTRKDLADRMRVYGPQVPAAIGRVLADPRFAPRSGLPFRVRTVVTGALRFAAPATASILLTLARPEAGRARTYREGAELERQTTAPVDLTTMEERLRFVENAARVLRPFIRMVAPLWVGMAASYAPHRLLDGIAEDGEIATVLRGMPHNPTTEMNLALWTLASEAREHRELLADTPPAELAARYLGGTLPDIGLDSFLARYGRRAVAEIDVGVPRWADDPTPVFAAIAGYLRLTDPEQAPDRRFARAAADAEAKLEELVRRALPSRPVRARLARWCMGRARAVAGLRELPKFNWLHGLHEMRTQLLLVGEELTGKGLLERPEDIMFLTMREAYAAINGSDLRGRVEERRATYEREMRRRSVPNVLLSDGTDPETLITPEPGGEGVRTGMAAAPGTVTGPARVILDPADARVEPGEILVAPSTDPGWTPLFMTAGGLVTETGSPVSHGPTVAREYGIPAVIGIGDATRTIRTGQRITVNGSTGTVSLDEPAGAGAEAAS
ncbi:pyruvate,water dikinase [Lipingzhangella halophila]|uniref:Pyruvate,water dikinase n=1 Tax=Lipingzhangella halophila TaxID=1783352 RepID=A0A7W7RIT7_9ACTN|nr:PEP/pyruvate-binding domain-containing protein [Lipingzhangella halophila]MBB4932677.1 pyruvate,water dikinase [Lipingzhangella halophila]